jgi:hypothetical protein
MMSMRFVMVALSLSAALLGATAHGSSEQTGASKHAARQSCGGIAAIPCATGYECVDDPRDDCDPAHGDADCSGICIKDKKDCNDPSKQYVSRDPAQCAVIHFLCTEGSFPFIDDCGCGCQTGEPCGAAVCGAEEYCCNESCGICAPEGGVCTQQFCGSEPPL